MTEYRRIAALGSSYAAGPGIRPVVNRAAMRSGNNYAHILARMIGAELTDLTVSGATTSTILDTPQRVGWVKFGPQIASMPADADLVLVTAGGNDLNYLGSAMKLAAYFTLDRFTNGRLRRWRPAAMPTVTVEQRSTATAGLARIVTESRRRAPGARVVLVDYLPIVGEMTVPFEDVPFDAASVEAMASVHEALNGVFADAADRAGGEVVHASQLGLAHELGSTSSWIQPLQPLYRWPSSFHPNSEGMKAVASALLKVVTQ